MPLRNDLWSRGRHEREPRLRSGLGPREAGRPWEAQPPSFTSLLPSLPVTLLSLVLLPSVVQGVPVGFKVFPSGFKEEKGRSRQNRLHLPGGGNTQHIGQQGNRIGGATCRCCKCEEPSEAAHFQTVGSEQRTEYAVAPTKAQGLPLTVCPSHIRPLH
eukprot:gene13731-biopygen15615